MPPSNPAPGCRPKPARASADDILLHGIRGIPGVGIIDHKGPRVRYRAKTLDALTEARVALIRAGLPVWVQVDPTTLEFVVEPR